MAEKNEIYKCEKCGNIVEIFEGGVGKLICCDMPMKTLEPMGKDKEGKEKHVPVIETEGNKVTVKVGSEPHPMEEEHHISVIELLRDGKVIASAVLEPTDKPEAEFCIEDTEGISARELCNVHGLWQH